MPPQLLQTPGPSPPPFRQVARASILGTPILDVKAAHSVAPRPQALGKRAAAVSTQKCDHAGSSFLFSFLLRP